MSSKKCDLIGAATIVAVTRMLPAIVTRPLHYTPGLGLAMADYVYNVIVLHMVAIDSDIDMAVESNLSSSYHVYHMYN